MFADRRDAGRRLGEAVAALALDTPLVLALPRGGVPVGYEVAQRLGAPLDIMVVRKLGTPGQPELAMGAIVGGSTPQIVFNDKLRAMSGASAAQIDAEIAAQRIELDRRHRAYAGERPDTPVKGRNVVLVDDGVATGATARAALLALRQAGAKRLVLAVPVGPAEVIDALAKIVDEVVCLQTPTPFQAVGEWYADFGQTSDAEVMALLGRAMPPP